MNKDQRAFFSLLKVGLWEKGSFDISCEDIDFKEVFHLAQEQAVVGLVTAGLEHLKGGTLIPPSNALSFVHFSLYVERRNQELNDFVAKLVVKMREKGIHAILVKGQGIAQCYERPLWRSSGDVDLLLDNANYMAAKDYLVAWASSVEEEDRINKHVGMTIDGWLVELHGTLRSGLWKGVDSVMGQIQDDVLLKGEVRAWRNGDVVVQLPGVSQDVIIVFVHILQHFFRGGIGLRQICDWTRLLWTSGNAINTKYIKSRLVAMGIMTEWRVFAAFAVNYLGAPKDSIPFFSPSFIWKIRASRALLFIMETGNFGHNRDVSYYGRYPYLLRKAISFWRHTWDAIRYLLIFPLDSIRVWFRRLYDGFKGVALGK